MSPDEQRAFDDRAFEFLADHPRGVPAEQLVRDVRGDDLDKGLFAIGLLQNWLDDERFVRVVKARGEGRSWGWIGSRLGVSRQSLWERYRDETDPPPSD